MELEKTRESPLDCKDTQPVHPKGNQSWIFIERTDAEAEIQILWPPDVKYWLTGKDLMLGKIEGRRRGWQSKRWLDGITDLMDMSLNKLQKLAIVKSLSHVQLFVTPWTVAYQTSQSMGLSRQQYWSGLPFPSPSDSDSEEQ